MPQGYTVDRKDSGNVAEQMMGRGDEKRAPKTFIEDGTLASYLGLVNGFPEMMLNMGRQLHCIEFGLKLEDVTNEDIIRMYPESREVLILHQRVIEHKASQQGFMVDRYVQHERAREEMDARKERKESSIDSKSKRWN